MIASINESYNHMSACMSLKLRHQYTLDGVTYATLIWIVVYHFHIIMMLPGHHSGRGLNPR